MDKNQQFLQGLNAIRNKAALQRGTVSGHLFLPEAAFQLVEA